MAIKNEKAINMSALMKNTSLSKLIKQAMNTPPGSAKRQKASSILNSFYKKRSTVMDGQGGGFSPSSSNPITENEKPFSIDATGSLVNGNSENANALTGVDKNLETRPTTQGSPFIFQGASPKKNKPFFYYQKL